VIGRASKSAEFRYGDAVAWLALNDDPNELRLDMVKASVSVQLVADVYRMSSRTVAADVCELRGKVAAGEPTGIGLRGKL
jgi:hypothetical protein